MDINAIFKTTVLCLALSSVSISYSAMAYDAKITITGTVKASPCKVDQLGGNVTVPLGDDIQAHTLIAGEGSGWKNFSLDLSDCPISTTDVTAKFTGLSAEANEGTDLYKNIATTTPAKGVQVEMAEATSGKRLGNGSTMKAIVDHQTNKATFPMKARVFSALGGATPGSVEAVVQVDLTYR